ncbi:MAG: hypothetical protein JWO02_3599, partial [Solirubrobacterales bacterium]|nr:hypothetical protein [Solirubrobacterales bacterium]
MTTDFALPALTPPPELLVSDERAVATSVIAAAQAEADAIRETARAEGHAAGIA